MGFVTRICVFIIYLLMVLPSAFSATYYIDATNGNDTLSGTIPDNTGNGIDGPWKTLSRLNQQTLVGNDSVLLRCDNQWPEVLDLDLLGPGTSFGADTITFGSYGSNCISKPRIQAADPVTGWVLDSNDSSGETYFTDSISTPIFQLLVDGEFLRPAQHPSFGYYSINTNSTGIDSKQYLIDTDHLLVPPGKNIDNAKIFIRTRHWQIEERLVTRFDEPTGKIQWDSNTGYSIVEGYGYYLSGVRWMLDERGEWYQDPVTSRVWVRLFHGDAPDNHELLASVREYGIVKASGAIISDIKITGLEISNPGTAGILLNNSLEVEISNIDIFNSGGQGVYLKNYGTDSNQELNTSVTNCTITNTVREAIWLKNHDNTIIDGNVVTNVGTIGAPVKTLAAIIAERGSTITNNVIQNTGYSGIRFFRNSTVKNNHVINTCTVLDDCAGIYTWHRPIINSVYATKDQYTVDDEYHSLVSDNIVEGATGNSIGYYNGTPQEQHIGGLSSAIYLDHGSNAITVSGNTLTGGEQGIYIQNAWNNTITGNKVYANQHSQIMLNEHSKAIQGDVIGNVVQGNMMLSLTLEEPLHLSGVYGHIDLAMYGSATTGEVNQYSTIYSRGVASQTYRPGAQRDYRRFEIENWEDSDGETFPEFGIKPFINITDDLGVNLISNSIFDIGSTPWIGHPNPLNYLDTVSCLGLDGACIEINANTDASSSANSNSFDLVRGEQYLLTFSAISDTDYQTVRVLTKISATSTPVGLEQLITVMSQRRDYELLFTATKDLQAMAKLQFEVVASNKIRLDNVYLYKVTENLITNSEFDTNISSWDGGQSTIRYREQCGLFAGCLDIEAGPTETNSADSSSFSLEKGKTYRLNFYAVAHRSDQHALVKAKLSGTETFIGLSERISILKQPKRFSFEFIATQSTDTANLNFEVDAGNHIFIDNVKLTEVKVQEASAEQDICIITNPSSLAHFIDCPDECGDTAKCNQFVDRRGEVVTWPVYLAGFDSEVFIWKSSPLRDTDHDGRIDTKDNCMLIENPQQADENNNAIGDACAIDFLDPSIYRKIVGTTAGINNINQSDDNYFSLKETKRRSSKAQVIWIFYNIPPGEESVTFAIEAFHTPNSENDDFEVLYRVPSLGTDWVESELIINKTSDDDQRQWMTLPSGTYGNVEIKIQDTDRTRGNIELDTLYIDQIFIRTETNRQPVD